MGNWSFFTAISGISWFLGPLCNKKTSALRIMGSQNGCLEIPDPCYAHPMILRVESIREFFVSCLSWSKPAWLATGSFEGFTRSSAALSGRTTVGWVGWWMVEDSPLENRNRMKPPSLSQWCFAKIFLNVYPKKLLVNFSPPFCCHINGHHTQWAPSAAISRVSL